MTTWRLTTAYRKHAAALRQRMTTKPYAGGMRLRVLFFGVLRERFGLHETLEQFPGRTVADLLQYYRAVSPELQDLWQTVAVAVNQQYSAAQTALADDDEIALLPPVSGGSVPFFAEVLVCR